MKPLLLAIAAIIIFNIGQTKAQSSNDSITIRKGLSTTFMMNGERLKPRELTQILQVNPQAATEISKANTNNTIGMICGGVGGFLVGYQLGTVLGGRDANMTAAIIGAGLVGVSIPFSLAYNAHVRNAVDIYNKGLEQANLRSIECQLGLCANGVGLSVRF
ncbi:MAG: hypothetical protein JEZ03_10920 [Bacteroidales bacterium]|nr:hypothetical protein [Bacteroidales bacterium]